MFICWKCRDLIIPYFYETNYGFNRFEFITNLGSTHFGSIAIRLIPLGKRSAVLRRFWKSSMQSLR